MKILIVNTSDLQGGAARAAFRLHRSLQAEGIDCTMLVQSKDSDDFTILGPKSSLGKMAQKVRPVLDALPLKIYKNRVRTLFSIGWLPFSDTVSQINKINPDIVHLHWINKGMMKIEDISRIKAPIIWSLHDNWAFTGGCHIKWECEKYTSVCGFCPNLASNCNFDLSRIGWKRKNKTYKTLKNLKIIGLSKWMRDEALKSSLLKDKQIVNLPNPINTSVFKVIDKKVACDIWNLPYSKKIILFGALDATSDINKGYNELLKAVKLLRDDDIELVVFGSNKPQTGTDFPFNTYYLGQINDDISLALLYNVAKVLVVPSHQENLSNVIMESLACGTPVVAFNVGGNSDMVEHLKNGYLAQPFNSEDMAAGIKWILDNENYDELAGNARKKVVTEFDSKLVAHRYIDLYKSILED